MGLATLAPYPVVLALAALTAFVSVIRVIRVIRIVCIVCFRGSLRLFTLNRLGCDLSGFRLFALATFSAINGTTTTGADGGY